MGGEKQAVLVYGPKKFYEIEELMKLLSVTNEEEAYDMLYINKMTNVFMDSNDWTNFRIGMIIDDYDLDNKIIKNKVIRFCKKYKLPNPTYFAGMIGEYE